MNHTVPVSLISFELYDENSNRLRGLVTVDLPELNYQTSEITGAGVLGQIDFPVRSHTENLETTLHFRTILKDNTDFMRHNSHDFVLRGAHELYDPKNGDRKVYPIKIVMRGLTKGLKLGKFESGSSTETELTLSLVYLKLVINDKELIEIDKLNYIHRVGSEDFMEAVRDALGL